MDKECLRSESTMASGEEERSCLCSVSSVFNEVSEVI